MQGIATKIRNQRFIAEYVGNGGNATQAAMVVYRPSTPNSAAVIGCEKVRELKPTILESLEEGGVTVRKVVRGINALLDAPPIVRVHKNGNETIEVESINYMAIDKGITQAMKIGLGGGYASTKCSHQSEQSTVQEMLDFVDQSEREPLK
jgi:hypothetical protein